MLKATSPSSFQSLELSFAEASQRDSAFRCRGSRGRLCGLTKGRAGRPSLSAHRLMGSELGPRRSGEVRYLRDLGKACALKPAEQRDMDLLILPREVHEQPRQKRAAEFDVVPVACLSRRAKHHEAHARSPDHLEPSSHGGSLPSLLSERGGMSVGESFLARSLDPPSVPHGGNWARPRPFAYSNSSRSRRPGFSFRVALAV